MDKNIIKTYQDNEEIGYIIDSHKQTFKVKCKHQYEYDSGDYFLTKCSHNDETGFGKVCNPRNCKHIE